MTPICSLEFLGARGWFHVADYRHSLALLWADVLIARRYGHAWRIVLPMANGGASCS